MAPIAQQRDLQPHREPLYFRHLFYMDRTGHATALIFIFLQGNNPVGGVNGGCDDQHGNSRQRTTDCLLQYFPFCPLNNRASLPVTSTRLVRR